METYSSICGGILQTKIAIDQGGKAYTFDISDPRYTKV